MTPSSGEVQFEGRPLHAALRKNRALRRSIQMVFQDPYEALNPRMSVGDLVGEPLVVQADEVIVSERPREGWSVINEQGETVALDLTLTPELVQAGLARDVIRFVQETRKATGLEVSDRISLQWAATDDLAAAVTAHAGLIADKVLTTSMAQGTPADGWAVEPDLGLKVLVTKA